MAKYLRVVGWEKYQHYKDRNPPWIKLYREILTSYTWTVLDDASRLLAVVCLLLAAETGNKIPLDRDYIQRRAQLKTRPDVRKLVDVGFAELQDDQLLIDDASKTLANSVPETETETDSKHKGRAYRLPEEWIPNEKHYTLAKEVGVIVDVELPRFRDHFLGNGAVKLDWDRTFNNWLRNAPRYRGNNGTHQQTSKQSRAEQVARNNIAAFAAAGMGGTAMDFGTVKVQGTDTTGNRPIQGEVKRLPK